jgi:hypothetical protein
MTFKILTFVPLRLPAKPTQLPLNWLALRKSALDFKRVQETNASMPEKQPLKALVMLKFGFESQHIICIELLQKVKQFRGGLHDRKWRGLGVVNYDWDSTCLGVSMTTITSSWGSSYTIRVQSEEPILFLLISRDIDEGLSDCLFVRIPRCHEGKWEACYIQCHSALSIPQA